MKILVQFILVAFICSASTCSAQEDPKVVSKDYESCCGTQPVEFAYDKKRIFVANIFTPNKDGANDYFYPAINDVITDVWGFTIYSAKGDTVLFQKTYFNSKMDVRDYGWDGLRPDGSRYKGLFKYRMRVDDRDANKYIVEGAACAVICGEESKIFKTKLGCFYPSQASTIGTLDKSKPNLEKDCL